MSRPLDPETLVYQLAMAGEPQVSPDGSTLVFSLAMTDSQTHERSSRLWSCAIDGTRRTPLSPAEQRVAGARWSPDGREVAYCAADDDGYAIFVLDINSESAARVVARHAQDVAELAWAPDGRRIAYTTLFDPDNPDEAPLPAGAAPPVRVTRRLDYKEDGRGYVGDRRRQVFVVEVSSGSVRMVTTDPVDHDLPQWSPDGKCLATRAHLRDRAGTALELVDVNTSVIDVVWESPGPVEHWSWSPAGDRLFFAADPDQTLQADFFVVNIDDKSTDRLTTELLSAPDPAAPVWVDARQVIVHAMRAGASQLELVDTGTGESTVLWAPQARNAGLSADRGVRFVVQNHATPETVGEICVFDRELGSARVVTEHNTSVLASHPAAKWEAFQVPNEGFDIDAWLLLPPDFDPARSYPVVLDVHGGPSSNYGYGFMAHQQCLATNGFLVVYPNPRGSTSYGRDFAGRVVRDWGGGDYRDVLAVLDAVLERPYADSDRTGIFGISYGGYLTSWAIGQTDRFAAAVCGEPIFDLESDYGTSDVAFRGLVHHGGGPPHRETEWYSAHSPSTFAHRIRTPTLIFHGEADQRCPIGQSEQMFVALRRADCETEYVRYPGGSHMFFAYGEPEHRVDFLTRTLNWFQDHLGGPAG